MLTQDAPEHDVVVVADESDVFGEYLPYRTWDPRPVAGTQGLIPSAWHRSQEQWGATQVQRRFEKFSGRWMTERDYTAWLTVRILGEAVTRTSSADPQTIVTIAATPSRSPRSRRGAELSPGTSNCASRS